MYAHARPAIHAETDGSLEPSVSTPIKSDLLVQQPPEFQNSECTRDVWSMIVHMLLQ